MRLQSLGNLPEFTVIERPRERYMKLKFAEDIGIAECLEKRCLRRRQAVMLAPIAVTLVEGRSKSIEACDAFGGKPIDAGCLSA